MSTIGRHHHGTRRDTQSECAYCGVVYLRSELRLNMEGFLACPDDWDGRTALEIDYQRAIDAAVPSEIRPARDKPAPSSAVTRLVAWGWFLGGTGERLAGTLRPRKNDAGLYVAEGATFDYATACSFDPGNPSLFVPRFYYTSVLDSSSILVRGHNRLSGADDVHSSTSGTGGYVVFAYAASGGGGVLTEVASAWVNGTTGEAYSSEGPIETSRTSLGLYTATITDGTTYTLATASQFSAAAVSGVDPAFVWPGKNSSTVAGIRATTQGGAQVDTDFVVQLWR